jgi:hypothetical protein
VSVLEDRARHRPGEHTRDDAALVATHHSEIGFPAERRESLGRHTSGRLDADMNIREVFAQTGQRLGKQPLVLLVGLDEATDHGNADQFRSRVVHEVGDPEWQTPKARLAEGEGQHGRGVLRGLGGDDDAAAGLSRADRAVDDHRTRGVPNHGKSDGA